jgi:pimeloyl-ACP methyl ester carboxylesterase
VLYEDLDGVVLLGFSYGGMVVTGALEHVAPRVRHLVYLDAFVPDDGQSLVDLTGAPMTAPMTVGQAWLVPPPSRDYDDPAEAAFSTVRRTPHPLACFTEPVRLAQPLEDLPFTRTYVRATGDAPDSPGGQAFAMAAQRARTSPAWEYHEIATGHMVPNNRPEELTAILAALA